MFDAKQIEELYSRMEAAENDAERKIIFLDAMRRTAEAEGHSPPVLVGGSAAELYSMGGYASLDMDLTGDEEYIAGFARRMGLESDPSHPNIFFSREHRLILDLRGKMDIDGATGRIKVLDMGGGRTVVAVSLEDIIIDRLVGYKRGGHAPSRHIAALLIRVNADELDADLLRQLATGEDVFAELEEILDQYPGLQETRGPS